MMITSSWRRRDWDRNLKWDECGGEGEASRTWSHEMSLFSIVDHTRALNLAWLCPVYSACRALPSENCTLCPWCYAIKCRSKCLLSQDLYFGGDFICGFTTGIVAVPLRAYADREGTLDFVLMSRLIERGNILPSFSDIKSKIIPATIKTLQPLIIQMRWFHTTPVQVKGILPYLH